MVVDVIIIVAVLIGMFFGLRRAVGTATGRRDCCSGDANPSGKKFRATRIEDTDEAHYPYATDLTVAGMSCQNCARNVENALDSIEGTWARVDLDTRTAHVLSKQPVVLDAYREVVSEAGYRVIS